MTTGAAVGTRTAGNAAAASRMRPMCLTARWWSRVPGRRVGLKRGAQSHLPWPVRGLIGHLPASPFGKRQWDGRYLDGFREQFL